MPETTLLAKHAAVSAKAEAALPEIVRILGKARNVALTLGMLAVLCTSEDDAAERAALEEEFLQKRGEFLDLINRKKVIGDFLGEVEAIRDNRNILHGFADQMEAMSETEVTLTKPDAIEMARVARHEVLPAIVAIKGYLSELKSMGEERTMRQMSEKAKLVDGMLAEMNRISRMIGLISINASVEAAHAGGQSGRSFQVIAQEVRSLAQQSSRVLGDMKDRLAEDAVAAEREQRAQPAHVAQF